MQSSHELKLVRFRLIDIKNATKNFSDKSRLGVWRHGEVYRGKISLMCKKYLFAVFKAFVDESSLHKEIERFSYFHNNNSILLVGYCQEKNMKILVYNFLESFSMYDYLFKYKDEQILILSMEQLVDILWGVAANIYYSTNKTHGEVKTANIYWQSNGSRCFQLLRTCTDDPYDVPKIKGDPQGTNGYLAPECYETNYEICVKADVYAIGVVLLELLCEKPASKNLIIVTLPFILKGDLPPFITAHVKTTISTDCSRVFANLIKGCLDNDPGKRPSMSEVMDALTLAKDLLEQEFAQNLKMDEGRWSCKRLSLEDIKRATNDFGIDNLLEEREFSKSYRGNINICGEAHNKVVTVKRITKELEHDFFFFMKELQLLEDCNHANILSILGYCKEKGEKIIVYKFMSNGFLHDYLYNDREGTSRLTMKQRLKICLGVAEGLSYLHMKGIIYRNLSTKNILLDHDLVPSISGVEFSSTKSYEKSTYPQLLEDYIRATVIIGTHHLAPECYEPNYLPDQKADVYAFGMLLLEMLCVKPPWKSLVILALEFANNGELSRFGHEYIKIDISTETLQTCENLIRDCLDIDPHKRPSMNQVVYELELASSHKSSPLNKPSSSSSCQRFLLSDIKRATNNFSDYLGEGAFGKVYSGNISNNRYYNGKVAVKRMMGVPEKQTPSFRKEIELVSACNHVNIIFLVGYCEEENEKILIYELMPNGSLYDYLHTRKERTRLSIEQRLEICIGVAKGLNYLHSRTDSVIIHSDLKTDNILLDQNLIPKISDFGLSRTRDAGPSTSNQTTNHIQGTDGYLAPECYEPKYKLSRKADVYAFGVVLLEMFCERPSWQNLVLLALPFITRGKLPKFTPDYVARHISKRCLRAYEHLVRECLDTNPVKRPDMNQVITKLENALSLEKRYSKDHLLPFTNPWLFSSSYHRVVLYYDGYQEPGEDQDENEGFEAQRILSTYDNWVDNRDVSLDPKFKDELQIIFGWRRTYVLPQLFIGGDHIGGINMIRKHDKDGTLAAMLHRAASSAPYHLLGEPYQDC